MNPARPANNYQFKLTCLRCGFEAYSQEALRIHFTQLKCKPYAVHCQCCDDIFYTKNDMAGHLTGRMSTVACRSTVNRLSVLLAWLLAPLLWCPRHPVSLFLLALPLSATRSVRLCHLLPLSLVLLLFVFPLRLRLFPHRLSGFTHPPGFVCSFLYSCCLPHHCSLFSVDSSFSCGSYFWLSGPSPLVFCSGRSLSSYCPGSGFLFGCHLGGYFHFSYPGGA